MGSTKDIWQAHMFGVIIYILYAWMDLFESFDLKGFFSMYLFGKSLFMVTNKDTRITFIE